MVSVCFVVMLVPPHVSPDVGLAPCVAGPAGSGHAPAGLVEWRTLSFQFFSVYAAMMAAVKIVLGCDGAISVPMDYENKKLELALRLAGFDGEISVPMDIDYKKLELASWLAGFEDEISVPREHDKAAAAFAGKCVLTSTQISDESKRVLVFPKDVQRKGEEGKEKEGVEEEQEGKEEEEKEKEKGVCSGDSSADGGTRIEVQ